MDRSFLVLIMALAVVVAACGTPAASQAPAATSGAPTAAAASSAPASPTPAAPMKIKIGVSVKVLPLSPAFVAVSKGYFKDNGLDAEIVTAPSLQCLTGVIAGQLDFCASAAQDVMVAAERGERMMLIGHIEREVALNFILRQDIVSDLKLTAKSPLKDRLAALKGRTLAVTGVGGAANQALNLMIKEAGLGEQDVKIVPIAAQAAQLAALLAKQIDGMVAGPPLSDQLEVGGVATILVHSSEIPVMSNIVYEAIYTTPKWVDEHPEQARGAVRAIVKANQFLRTDAQAGAYLNSTDFNAISSEVLTLSLGRLRDNFVPDACITAAQAAGLVKYGRDVGILTKDVDAAEGGFWTNKYNEAGCK